VSKKVPEDDRGAIYDMVNKSVVDRRERRLLVSMPIDAPDGRKVTIQLREGDQHQLGRIVGDFCTAMRFAHAGNQVLAAVETKLPPAILYLPVELPGLGRLQMRLCSTDSVRVEEEVRSFCGVHDIPMEHVGRLTHHALSSLFPRSHVVPFPDTASIIPGWLLKAREEAAKAQRS
jgi:hypothetical protein